MKFCIISFLLCLYLQGVRAQIARNQILWDTYGVPHIYARSIGEMYHEFGWAQMHNHANLLLRLLGQARGRAAEYWGAGYLASDQQVHLFQLPSLAAQGIARQDPAFREILDSFTRGINAYAVAHPEAITEDNRQVLPVRSEDILAHGMRVIFLRFVAGDNLGMASRAGKAGSNAYAIGPSRSASGHAMLLANPHLPWADLFTFFEAHLQAPGFNAYGAAVVGLPVLNIAFNDHLGWTHTVNTINASSRYELTVHGDSYLLDSNLVPFEKRSVLLKVRQPDKTLKEQTVALQYARHGPVVSIKGEKAYAVRIAGLENPDIFYQWHRMAAAASWQQFEQALKMMQLPMFNVIYADDRGNISYLFDGNVPRRSEGDWAFWNGAVDGRYSRYIWKETLGYDELPKVFDPGTGFVQNANDPPWNCTSPGLLAHRDYPGYISPLGMSLRAQRAVNMVKSGGPVTMEKLEGYKLNTGMEAADRFLKELIHAGIGATDSLSLRALAVLQRWDGMTNADSRGAVLFSRWFDRLSVGMFAKPWTPDDPVGTPAGLKDPAAAIDSLREAAREIIRDYDSLNVAWGDVYRFKLGAFDFPANGAPDKYGTYRTLYYAKDGPKQYRAVAGDSYVAITEFGKRVRARVLLSYGNASQPGNRHTGDQLLLLSQKRLRNAWLDKAEILKNLEETQNF